MQDFKAGATNSHHVPVDRKKGHPHPDYGTLTILVAALGILLAFGLYLATLTQRSIWTDELSTLAMFPAPDVRALVQQVADTERRPPLYFILVWAWSKIAGTNEFALRYFSLGFVTLAIALWFALARGLRTLFGIRQRAFVWLAFALGAVAPDIALYGVMLRYYAFLLCLSLVLNLIFVRWLFAHGNPDPATKEQRHHRNGATLVACWLVVALVLAYSDYSVSALILAQLIWLSVHARSLGRKLRPWVLAIAILLAAYLPQLATLRTQVGHDGLQADLSQSPVGVILKLSYPIFSYMFGETILPWHPLVLVTIPFLVLALGGLMWKLRTHPIVRFCLLFVTVPILFNVLIQTTVATDLTFLTMASRTWFVLPLFVMLVALGIVELPTRIKVFAMTILLVANLAALGNLFSREQYHNPIFAVPLREVAAAIRSESMPGDVLLADFDIGFQYYWQMQRTPQTQFFRSEDWPTPQGAVNAAQPPRVWLIAFGRDRTRVGDHSDEIRTWLTPTYAQRIERKYVPIDPTYKSIKQWLLGRETYDAKLMVQRYDRVP